MISSALAILGSYHQTNHHFFSIIYLHERDSFFVLNFSTKIRWLRLFVAY